jgi:HAD superfamily hydrolase (TIGR01549 family)
LIFGVCALNILGCIMIFWEAGIWMAPKAILFDMFDTLFMITKNHMFYRAALRGMFDFVVSKGVKVSFVKFRDTYVSERDALYEVADVNWEEPHFNVRVSNTLKKLGYNYDVSNPIVTEATEKFCVEFMKFVEVDVHAKSVLKKLHGKYKLGLVSNFAIPECVLKLLQNEDVEKMFDVILISGAVNKRKPSPEIFTNALRCLGVKASEAVFVGDTPDADVAGAQAVGMKAVYVERRFEEGLKLVTPDALVKSLGDLPAVILQF